MTRRFIIRLSSQIKGSYVVQIRSEKNSVSKENELFGYYQVYQDGIIVKMMEKDQTFQEN